MRNYKYIHFATYNRVTIDAIQDKRVIIVMWIEYAFEEVLYFMCSYHT